MPTDAREVDVVFNVVVTPGTFRFLQFFTRSLLAQSEVRLRLVANGCPPAELKTIHDFAAEHRRRVETFPLPSPAMQPHGAALDQVYLAHDDGEYFCFVDSDVKAKRPFMPMFLELLTRADAVTSGNVAWAEDTVLPAGSPDLPGRYAFGHDGFVYGSSYLAIYARGAVERVREHWGVTFRATASEKLPAPVQRQLAAMGRQFGHYDTAKVMNILLQGDGFVLTHVENPALVHIGGISQYLSDPSVLGRDSGAAESAEAPVPWFAASASGRDRWEFARWAATMLRSLVDGEPEPDLPEDAQQRPRANAVRRELLDLTGQ
jgi:hypothetical protein